jgi:hypothetical protein
MRILSMPDKWEYPWFAAWDLAFHTAAFAVIDPEFAKEQLFLTLFEQFQHPSGQIPAYEWEFSDLNPPVHAWAVWRVYNSDKLRNGVGDREFLEKCFHKLLINFTGGSPRLTVPATTFSKAASSVWTTLPSLTAAISFPAGPFSNNRTPPTGWGCFA